jgi:hypothetical protein
MVIKYSFILVVFFWFLTVTTFFSTCDIFNSETYNNLCYCEQKAHLGKDETCKCGADKGACKCTEQIAFLEGILIRKDANYKVPLMYYAVTDMNIAVNNIATAYMWLSIDEMAVFKNKIKEIHIILGNEKHIILKGTILEIGASANDFEIYLGIQNWVLSS